MITAWLPWLPWLPSGYHGNCLVTTVTVWLPCLLPGYHCYCIVTMVTAWLPWLRPGNYLVTILLAGYHGQNLVTIVTVWLPWLLTGNHGNWLQEQWMMKPSLCRPRQRIVKAMSLITIFQLLELSFTNLAVIMRKMSAFIHL